MPREEFLEVPDESDLPTISQADLSKAVRAHADYLKGKQGGARAVLKFKDISGLDLSDSDLSHADFTGSRLAGTNLSYCQMEGAIFFACDMRNADLRSANLTRADLRGAYLSGANMAGANLDRADMREGKIMKRDSKGVLTNRDRGMLSGTKTVLSGARLTNASLKDIDARGADFSDVDLSGALIQQADCEGANFENANLADSDLTNAKMSRTNLRGAVTANSLMKNTELFDAQQEDVKGDHDMGQKLETLGKSLEELLADHHKWVSSAGRESGQLDLSGFDLRDILKLNKYELTAVKAIGATFLTQNLQGAHLQHAHLDKSDFRDCRLLKADMRASSLKYALFARADAREINFSPLYFANPDGTKRMKAVDLTGADFRYADLREANFSHAILTGADFSHAILNRANFNEADLSGALLKGTILE